MKYRIGVVFGGKSVEHEISVITAIQTMKHIDLDKYDVIPIYITKDLQWYTGAMLKDFESYKDFSLIKRYAAKINFVNKNGRFVLEKTNLFKTELYEVDLVIPIAHGCNMEDGSIQGYLNILGVPYVGSNIYSSAVGQDKVFMKQIFKANDIPITNYLWFYDYEYQKNYDEITKNIDKLGYPVVIKPATLGSSIGINKIMSAKELKKAIKDVMMYDTKIIVEKIVDNMVEINCSVLGDYENVIVSEIEEVLKKDEILTYKDKYQGSSISSGKGMVASRRIMPARINEQLYNEVIRLSKKVFATLNNSGVVRVDFLIDGKKKKVYVNEINTIPGSLSYYLWEPKNIDYRELMDKLITLTVNSYKKKQHMISSFDTNILAKNNFTNKK